MEAALVVTRVIYLLDVLVAAGAVGEVVEHGGFLSSAVELGEVAAVVHPRHPVICKKFHLFPVKPPVVVQNVGVPSLPVLVVELVLRPEPGVITAQA